MLKKDKIILFCLLLANAARAQNVNMSSDGNYLTNYYSASSHNEYFQGFEPQYAAAILIKSTTSQWQKTVYAAQLGAPVFSTGGKRLLFIQNMDTLCIMDLGKGVTKKIPGIQSLKTPKTDKPSWFGYQLKNKPDVLHLENLQSGKTILADCVDSYEFTENASGLLVHENDNAHSLKWVDFATGQQTVFWHGAILNYKINPAGDGVAFEVKSISFIDTLTDIWYYKFGMAKSKVLVKGNLLIDSNLKVCQDELKFTPDGSRVFFKLKERPLETPKVPSMVKVDIVTYRDVRVQTQSVLSAPARTYLAVASVDSLKVIRLERKDEVFLQQSSSNSSLVLVCHFKPDVLVLDSHGVSGAYTLNEYSWNRALTSDIYMVSLKDGARKILAGGYRCYSANLPDFQVSVGGRYIVYYDFIKGNYFSYRVQDSKVRELTKNAQTTWEIGDSGSRQRDYYATSDSNTGITGWGTNDRFLLIFDHFHDIWKIDPDGRQKPVNLTNSFARKNEQIRGFADLELINHRDGWIVKKDMFLTARDTRTFGESFYKININESKTPILLLNGAKYSYEIVKISDDRQRIILTRQSYTNMPSSFYLYDSKHLEPLIPENMGKLRKPHLAKVLFWTMPDGSRNYGLLSYPKNFDPKKKYPVFISYYEGAGPLNQFGGFSGDDWNNRGYFTFRPNICYRIGYTAKTVCNSIVGGAKQLMKYPYIDGKRMGITGGSFGGYETNILVSRTHIFAAAASDVGLTDMVSNYLLEDRDPEGFNHTASVETGQMRIGATLWDRPDLYLQNSPVFFADCITTPLLIGIGRKDRRVEGSQGTELFMALRRLGKPSWLLAYDDAGHGLGSDWAIRVNQFFDHYLKGSPAPVWMTQGVPARLKGQTLGLELDTVNKIPGPGIKLKKEILTPTQKALLKHKTTVSPDGKIINAAHP